MEAAKSSENQKVDSSNQLVNTNQAASNLQQLHSQRSDKQQQQQAALSTKLPLTHHTSYNLSSNPNQVFITSYTKTGEGQLSIPDLFNQFHGIIERLDEKVDTVIERHEAEFLMAYRNHMQKIKKELQEMKRRTEEQEKSFHANDRISGLEKQLNWYRDESLKLYSKLELKNKELDELRMKIDEFNKEKQFLEEQVKSLLKKNKYLEVKLINQQSGVRVTESNRAFDEKSAYSEQQQRKSQLVLDQLNDAVDP